jgi:G3E family GTPase
MHVHHKNIHDDGVASASFVIDGAMDLQKLNLWLGMLLQARGEDIYRMKGILNIKHNKERFVFQVCHPSVRGMRA